MKIFLSGLESNTSFNDTCWVNNLDKLPFKLKWNLCSFFYCRGNTGKAKKAQIIRDNSELMLIDSGAHSFQKGVKHGRDIDWEKYTRSYADFIREFDRPNVLGYFEMDVDAIIGHEKVLALRKILLKVTDKIIPVWHKNRGIADFDSVCREYSGKIIAVSGFRNEDISDDQYLMFLKHAHKYNCRVHALGMARPKILDKVPFDYTDSSSWGQATIFAYVFREDGKHHKLKSEWCRDSTNREGLSLWNYKYGMKMQKHYYEKWRHYDEDFGGTGWRQLTGRQDGICDNLR
jgi:hypothetical protein